MKRVKRPWGHYIIIHKSKNYLIKKIVILPNESISLQLHHHRSEHWIVINGIAKIQIGNKKIKLTQNQSTYVSLLSHPLWGARGGGAGIRILFDFV